MGYERIGNSEKSVAIIETTGQWSKDKDYAKKILAQSKSIKSVLVKKSKRKGKLRIREYSVILGEKNTEVLHKEYGYVMKVDPRKVYFSARELTERQRIAQQVKNNEKILVMFSGVAPFILAIKKKNSTVEVIGIELNKEAHKYAEENIKLNKLNKVRLFNGDVNKLVPKLKQKFNRILLPLPKTANEYLNLAFSKVKKMGVIHYYYWGTEKEFRKIKDELKDIANKSGKKISILKIKKVLPYAPRVYKLAIDIKVLN